MIAASMFSGIGAPEQAMPGWDWIWHAEIENFPNTVMAERHPQSVNLGDVNAEDFIERAKERGQANVLVFGSPCQSFSVAGERLGLDDARGNLAIIALGIIDRLKPRWFAFENVPGLFSSYSGSEREESEVGKGAIGGWLEGEENRDFATFLSRVYDIGYHGAWTVLDAQYFGLAQRRERLFFVGHSRDWRGPAAVLFEPEGLCGYHPPRRAERERVAPTIEARANAGGAGWGTDFLAGGGMAAFDERKITAPNDGSTIGDLSPSIDQRPPAISGAVSRKWEKGAGGAAGDECYNLVAFDETQITHPENRSRPDDRSPQLAATARPPTIAFSGKDYGADAGEIAPTLRSMGHAESHANGGGQVAVAFQTRIARNGRGQPTEIAPSLNGADAGATSDMRPCVATFKPSHYTRGKDGAPAEQCPPLTKETDKGDQDPVLLDGAAVRRLTPRECERLQGYPDDYTLVTYRGKPAADGPRYKALGNSMAVPVIKWILNRIETVDALLENRL